MVLGRLYRDSCIRTFIFFVFSALAFGLHAQPKYPYDSLYVDKFTKFTNYLKHDGVCSYTFTDIIQDNDGFIWIATKEGLMRFDGYTFQTFLAGENKNQLPSNYIYTLAVDSEGTLWIGTRGGLCKYQSHNNDFIRISYFFDTPIPSADSWIMKLYFDSKNRLWIDGYGGILSCVNFSEKTVKSYQHNFYENQIYHHHTIKEMENGLLVGGASSLLSFLDLEAESWKMINPKVVDSDILFQQGYSDTYDVGDGKLWIFSFSGKAACFDKHSFELTPLPFTSVYSVALNGDGRIWIGGYSNGARLYNPSSNSITYYINDENNLHSLAGNKIFKIFKDKQGNFWFGTDGGLSVLSKKLNRFQHVRKIPESNGLPTNDVTSLLSTKPNELWIGTRNKGLVKYDVNKNAFKTYRYFNSSDSIGSNFVTSIAGYDENSLYLTLWNGRGGAFNEYSLTKGKFTRYLFNDNYFWYRSVLKHSTGKVLIGPWGTGVYEFDRERGNVNSSSFTDFNLGPRIFGNSSFIVKCNEKGWVYFTGSYFLNNVLSGDSLILLTDYTAMFTQTFEDKSIVCKNSVREDIHKECAFKGDTFFLLYPRGIIGKVNLTDRNMSIVYCDPKKDFTNLFVDSSVYLTESNRLYVWNETIQKPELILADSSLANISSCSAIDSRRLFIGTSTGLFVAMKGNDQAWKVEKKIFEGQVNSLTKANSLTFAATLKGLLKVDDEGNVLNVFFKDRSIISSTLDSSGNVWIALDKGLFRMNYKNDKIEELIPNPTDKNGLPSNKVYSLATDAKGNVWLSTDVVTTTYNPQTNHYTSFYEPYRKTLSSGLVYDLYEDRQGYVWVCYTENNGIDRIDLKSRDVLHFNNLPFEPESFPKSAAYCIRELSDGTIAVGTDKGLALMHGRENSFTIIGTEQGFPSDHITAIAEDKHGIIWLGSTAGYFKYNRADKSVQTFSHSDGMQEGTISTIIPFNNWLLAAGGAGGVNIINPENSTFDTTSVQVRVTRCVVDADKELFNLQKNQQIILEPDYKTIQFEFTALDFGSPSSVRYSYMLEGFDDTLIFTTSQFRIAAYSNLPPGNYALRINATNADGVWSENPFVLNIRVKKPFYLKLWFLLIAFSAVCGIVYLIIKWRERWLRSENIRLDRIVLERTAEVSQQNEEIRAQRDIIANQSEEIKQVNLHLTDSIEYALTLQSAMMPSELELKGILGEYFLVFKPKDIVSGDFYWVKGNPQQFTVIVADCTGHGVHGGFMSMLGLSFVSETYESTNNPYEIVKGIHHHFTEAITVSVENKLVTAGMDVGVCSVDRNKGVIAFTGTRLPLYLTRRNGLEVELKKFRSGKKPVGSPWFTNDIPIHEIEIKKGDTIYISTDGAFDQLSKVERKRFNRAQFEELLVQISNKTLEEQGKIIDEKLSAWQDAGIQTDDISVLGFRI